MTNFDAEQIVAEARDKGEPALETLVFQALGAASACWENLEGAGVFESTRAKDIGDQTVAAIRGLDDGTAGGGPQGPVERIAHWAREVLDNDGALTADSSMSLDMAHDELTQAALEYLGIAGEYKTKDSTHCDAKASWGSNRLTHTHECTKDEHHARERHECECGASWLAKVEA
jgi:hypothetical protein